MKPTLVSLWRFLKAAWGRKWRLMGVGALFLAAAMFLVHWDGDPHPWGADAVIDLRDGPPKNEYPLIQIDDGAAHIRVAWFEPYAGKSIEDEAPICVLDYDIHARQSRISHPQRMDAFSYHWHTFAPGSLPLKQRYFAVPFPTWALRGGADLSLTPCLAKGWNGLAESCFQGEGVTRTLAWQGLLAGSRRVPQNLPPPGLLTQKESLFAALVPEGGHSIYLFNLAPERAEGLAQGPKPSDSIETHKTFLLIHK